MFETLLKYFQDSPLSAWGPFLVLILCGLGLPVPEDIVLVVAGALAVMDGHSWIEVSILMYAGVMIGDSTIFLAGRFLGGKLREATWFQRYISIAKQAKVETMFDRYHSMVLFFGRFLPGLRAPIFFTAGSMKVGYWKFFLLDGTAALVSVPFFVWLGQWLWLKFQDDIVALQHALSKTQYYTLLVAATIAMGLLIAVRIWWRRVHAPKE